MQYLFDMIAGTSTGSILSTALSIENDNGEPLLWGKECKESYITLAPDIFKEKTLSVITKVFLYIMFIACFGGIFYFLGRHKYDNPKKIEAFNKTHQFLRERQEQLVT